MAKYKIFGRYKDGDWEVIDTASTLSQAQYLLAEYKIAYGSTCTLIIATKGPR